MSRSEICRCPALPASGTAIPDFGQSCPRCGRPYRSGSVPLAAPGCDPSPDFQGLAQAGSRSCVPAERVVIQTESPPRSASAPRAAVASRQVVNAEKNGSDLASKAKHGHQTQRNVSRLLGGLVMIWSLLSLIPCGLAWWDWLSDFPCGSLPLWLPYNLVLAGLPLLLGLMLLQIPDWATLQAVACGLLVIASAYGFAASLLGLAKPDSPWLAGFDFPFSETDRATVWSWAMLILAACLSFSCFREGQRWRRVEQLLVELLPTSNQPPAGRN